MAFESTAFDRYLNPAIPVASPLAGDTKPEEGSLVEPLILSGSMPTEDVPDRPAPRPINYATPQDDTVPKVGPAADVFQLDTDPTGELTKRYGAATGQSLSNNDIVSLNVLGKRMSRGALAQTDEGRKLLEIADRRRQGHRRNFFDAMDPTEWGPEKLPFLSLFATVGKSIKDAVTVSNTFEKMQKGEAVSDDELVKTALYVNENRERTDGTWGSTVGDIVSQAPTFMIEFLASGGMLGAARTVVSKKLGEMGSVKALSHVGLRRIEKILTDETAEQTVGAGIAKFAEQVTKDTSKKGLVQAAADFGSNAALRKDTVSTVADVLERSMLTADAAKITGADKWAPGVVRKVAERRAEEAVAAAIARRSSSSAVQNAVKAAGRVLGDGVSRGVLDVGNWGTEASTVLFTERSSAGRALVDALNTFLVEAPLKGGELMLANKAVTAVPSAMLGGTVGGQELAIKQAAYMNNDEDLMNKAHAIGLGLDLLEYVSENTGRGLKSLMRAGALAVNPKLAKATAKAVGQLHVTDAKLKLEPSETGWVANGVEYSGLLEPGSGAEVGGIINRFISKVLGKPEDMRTATRAKKFDAVKSVLEKDGIRVANPAALEGTIAEGVVQPGLDPRIAERIGSDVNGFVKNALDASFRDAEGKLKVKAFAQYWAADFMARHQIGPQTAIDMFDKMGYDGIAGEMFEERYNDVVAGLFGLDAEKDHSLKGRVSHALQGLYPGWDQLTAEAVGFAFPLVARTATIRALNAIGGERAYAEYRENSAKYLDAVRFGTVGQWRLGDLVTGHGRAVAAEEAKRKAAEDRKAQVLASRPADADDQWDFRNVRPIDDEIATANRAIKRLGDVHEAFMNSLSEDARGDMNSVVDFAPMSIEEAEAPDEAYNRKIHATDAQARQSASAAHTLVKAAGKMGQTLYKMQSPAEGDDIGMFRKASHWLVKAAGAMVTVDPGLMSINPARWHGADVGLPETVQDALRDAYGAIYTEELSLRQKAKAENAVNEEGSIHEVNVDEAHEAALAKFQPIAEQIMAADLAAHQTMMFSDSELLDLAMNDYARRRDLAPDTATREYVSPTGERVSFEDFYAKNKKYIDVGRKHLAEQAYDLFSSGALQQGRIHFHRGSDGVAVADVIDIPKDLPTRHQAVLATVLKGIPGLRNVLRARQINPNLSLDDQLGGMATRQAWLDKVADTVLPSGVITADARDAALANADKVDPVVVEAVAKDLGFSYDGTEASLKDRNRKIVELAVLSRTLSDPNVRTYTQDGAVAPESSVSSVWQNFTTARRMSDGRWAYTKDDGKTAVANTVEELDARMAEMSWHKTEPKVVFTAAQILQSDDAGTMIGTLGLKKVYRDAMRDAAGAEARYMDPLYREGSEGFNNPAKADVIREKERRDAQRFIDHNNQTRVELYLEKGESRDNEADMEKAKKRLDSAMFAYYSRHDEERGYVTVANRLLEQRGCTVPYGNSGISIGTISSDLRGKYTISINAFRSHRQSNNIYVPINHETAQNYKTALLNATLVDAYFKNRRVVNDVFDSGIRAFMEAVDRIADEEYQTLTSAKNARGNEDLAANIKAFRAATTYHEKGQVRKPSAQAFALLSSAFALYQTEHEGNLKSYLGQYAPACRHLAKRVRGDESFLRFTAALDRVFGGAGFNPAAIRVQGSADATRGIARIYALFAPEGKPTLTQAIKDAAPGGLSVDEFVKRVNEMDTDAWKATKPRPSAQKSEVPKGGATANVAAMKSVQDRIDQDNLDERAADAIVTEAAKKPRKRKGTSVDELDFDAMEARARAWHAKKQAAPSKPAEAPKPAPVDKKPAEAPAPKNVKKSRRRSHEEAFDDIEDRLARFKRIQEQRKAAADSKGGESSVEQVLAEEHYQGLKSTEELIKDAIADDQEDKDALEARRESEDNVADEGEGDIEGVDYEIIEDLFVGDMGAYSVNDTQTAVNAEGKPNEPVVRDRSELTQAEIKSITVVVGSAAQVIDAEEPTADRVRELVEWLVPGIREKDLGQILKTFAQMDKNAREKEIKDLWTWAADDVEEGALPDGYENGNAKSVAALRDNKALNNFLAFAQLVNPHTGRGFQAFVEDMRSTVDRAIRKSTRPALTEALKFVDRLINPRADVSATAAIRDAKFNEVLDFFTADDRHQDDVARYINLLLNDGDPVNRKAAWTLMYLAAMPKNVRMQMTQLIASSAPSDPVHLRTYRTLDGNVHFVIAPRSGNSSRLSTSAVSAMYTKFAGRTGAELTEAAAKLRTRAEEMTKSGAFDHDSAVDLFESMADLLGEQFGQDCPLVSVFSSRPAAAHCDERFGDAIVANMSAKSGVPYMVDTIAGGLEYLAEVTGDGVVSPKDAEMTAVFVVTSGNPTTGGLGWETNTSKKTDQLATVFRAYEEVMPHTIMTAEIDPSRTRQAASSIAITMRGIEPAIQVFMDRTDEFGFRAVCEKYFPEFKALSETEKLVRLGYCRQHMCWPDAVGTRIVAKSLSKSAYARETYRGCETSFGLGKKLADIAALAEVDEDASAAGIAALRKSFGDQAEAILGQYRDSNVFYVPVYSGDHSSSVLISVPLAKDFRGVGYEKAATEVSKWVGLDLLGVDAKRSATTSLEAPGVGFIGFKRDPKTGKKILKRDFKIGDTSYRGREVVWVDDLKSKDGTRSISGQYRRGENRIYMSKKGLEDTFARKAWRKPVNSRPVSDSYFATLDDLAQFVVLHETAHAELGVRPAEVTPSKWEDRMNAWAIEQLARREAETGECRINIVWTSEAGKNEAGLGTTLATGYGVERLKKCAKNPNSSTLKFHAMNTAATGKYGAALTFLKSLNLALDNDKEAAREAAGDFLECDSKKVLFDFIRKQRSSDAGWSTSILTDFDSMKLGLANSKMMGVPDAKGELGSLMEYVFQVIGDKIRDGADLDSSYSGNALDELIGEFKWVDNSNPAKSIEVARVSDILDNIRLDRIEGLEGQAYSLSFTDNDIMGFQVANVSHEARTSKDYGKTPRNYMIDAFTMAEVLGRGWEADASLSPDSDVFPDEWQVLEDLQDLVANWGTLASDIASRRETVRSVLDEDEDANEARLRGEPENGRFMRDIRARALATYLKKNLNIPINGIDAPLVSNMSWIGKDGTVRCHSKSQMFKDTLRGSRTIKASERRFYRGHRRMAICNVNNNDSSFRYGLYLDEEKFKQIFGRASQFYYGKYRDQDGVTRKAGNEDQQITAAIGDIITRIRDLELGDTFNDIDNDARVLRESLMSCFMDHHGNHMDERSRTVKETRRDRKTGAVTVTERTESFFETVSFSDLFTNLVKVGDRAVFDRTAVYCGDQRMTLDADGRKHIYLGGTMMGLPRTPSYNGSMWLQTVRAGLPCTERGEETDWRPGTDAMVAPDPFSLAILGCDHDGDKTKLYMLNTPSRSAEARTKRDKALAEGDHFLAMDRFRKGDYEYLLERRATRNEKNPKTLDLHEWQVTDIGRTQANNTFVQSLFDMSRMLPVMDRSEAEVPFYTGDRIDENENHGAPAIGTKASLVYKELWNSEIVRNSSVIADKLLDPSDPKKKKNVGNPYTAALIGDGAQNAADARAIAVSLASSLHLAWASGLFNNTLFHSVKFDAESSRCWLDFIHHIDGLSNMTFDDIKEQVCSRLGITAGMMDSVIVGLINHTVMSGKGLPRTDRDFVKAFADYAKKANGRSGNTWLYYMNRATNKGDFEFQNHVRKLFGTGGEIDQESIANKLGLVKDTMTGMWKPGANAHPFIRHVAGYNGPLARIDRDGCFTARENLVNAIVTEGVRENDDLIAAVAYALDSNPGEAARTAQDLVEWYYTRSELKLAKSFARSFNYLVADPVAPSADSMDENMDTAWKRVMAVRTKGADADKLARLEKMRTAVERMYRLSDSRTFDGYATRAFDKFGETYDELATEAAVQRKGDPRTAEFVVALASAEKLQRSDRMNLEANAQMTGLALAAFRTVRQLPGSKISSANALKVLRAFADGSAATFKGTDNPGLSMCRGIEHVFELMYRLANSSTARRDLPIFSYFSERPETAFGFNFDTYFSRGDQFSPDILNGRAIAKRNARELGRITMAFQGITEGQMSDIRDLWTRVVEGRELDPDGTLGKRQDIYTERESKVGFSISEENLKALESELGLFDKETATDSQKLKMKKAKQRYGREIETFRFLIAEARNVLAELNKIGVDSVTPSSMFGQILPLYAVLTSRLDRVPDSRTPSIVTVMPGVYRTWADELAKLDAGDLSGEVLQSLVPVNWAARNYSRESESLDPMSKRGRRLSAEEFSKKVSETKTSLTNLARIRKEFRTQGLVLENPNGRHFIDPFGNNGLFGRALEFLGSDTGAVRKPAPSADVSPTVLANAVDAAIPGTTAEASDPFTKELSTRMSALISKFNGGRVEYAGGKSFAIRVKLSGSAAAKAGTSEAVIRVDVVPRVEPIDESNVKDLVSAENWRSSVKASQDWTDEELDKRIAKCKTPKALVRFAERFRPVGKSNDTEWTVDARGLKVLSGTIRLEEQSKYKGTLYHEYFHQMMSMVRQLGVLSDEDIRVLRDSDNYGASALREGWFDEEKAANAFEKFVLKGEGRNDVFAKILDFIKSFVAMFRDTGVTSEAFANDMSESPLAFMALTGRMDTRTVNDVIIEPAVAKATDDAINGTLVQEDLFPVEETPVVPLDQRPNFADVSRHAVNSMKARVRSAEREWERGGHGAHGYDDAVSNPFYKGGLDTKNNQLYVSKDGETRVLDIYHDLLLQHGIDFRIGYSVTRFPRERLEQLPLQLQDAVTHLSFESLLLAIDESADAFGEVSAEYLDNLYDLAEALDRLDELTVMSRRYEDALVDQGVDAEKAKSLASSGFQKFRNRLRQDYLGMNFVLDPSHAVTNGGEAFRVSDNHYMRPFDVEDMGEGTDALNVIFPERASGNYSQMNTFARAVGLAIKNGMSISGLDAEAADILRTYDARSARDCFRAGERAAAEEAVRQVASMYGVELGKRNTATKNRVFRALCEVNSMASSYKARSNGPVDGQLGRFLSPTDLASAIAVSCGTTPVHMALSVKRDIAKLRTGYKGTSFEKVLDKCETAMNELMKFDASHLNDSGYGEELIGRLIHGIEAGLLGGGMNYETGVRDRYYLGELDSSENPAANANIADYGSHVDENGDGNEDFQYVMRRTLDTMYGALAGMKYMRELDFVGGDAGEIAPAKVPHKSPDETSAMLGIEARQLLDRNFDAIDFFDQPSFVANNMDAYLESSVRRTFGHEDVGRLQMDVVNKLSGFNRRFVNANNWLNALLGQNVLPGQRLFEASLVDGKFAMENGQVVSKAEGRHVKFEMYRGKRRKVSLTEDEHRLVDYVLKADKAWYQGAKNVITGVDNIRFTPDDLEARSEDYYSRENVEKRRASGKEVSRIDETLYRLDFQIPPMFVEDIRARLVRSVVTGLDKARSLTFSANAQSLTDYMLYRLEGDGLVVAHQADVAGPGTRRGNKPNRVLDQGVLVIPVEDIENAFQNSTAIEKLIDARDNLADTREEVRKMFSRENRIAPLHRLYTEFKQIVREFPWLTDGDGAFFNNEGTPLAFVRGTGVFMYNANRKAREVPKSAMGDLSAREETFLGMMRGFEENDPKSLDAVTAPQLRLIADVFGTREKDPEELRRAIKDGRYAAGTPKSRETGFVMEPNANVRDVTLAIYNRFVEAAWRENGDPVVERCGGHAAISRMISMYELHREDDTMPSGGVGLTDEQVYRCNAMLPANHQLGHAISNQILGIANAVTFRNTLVNMLMTPDMKGRPVMYADPSALAAQQGGVPDAVWGQIARWWASANSAFGIRYDEGKSGIDNAREVYRQIRDVFAKHGGIPTGEKNADGKIEVVKYGELKADELDAKSIVGVLAQSDDHEAKLNTLGGGYAMGYAKQLMQASRNLGSAAQRAVIHRALSWSKSLSVSFSFFFPLATKLESPTGAVGMVAMLGSNFAPDAVRKNPELFNAIQKVFSGDGWLTSDFIGFKDVIAMMDSDDPFLSEMIGWASALGVQLSDANNNPIEPQRSVLQRDLANMREMVRDRMGAKAAKNFDNLTRTLLLRSGDKAFTYALNATKLATVAQICMKLRHEAEKQGRAFDPIRDLKRYSGYINAEIGGIDPLKYAWAHPMNRSLMSMLMFSWEWTRGAWEAGGGGVIEDFLFGGHSTTAEERAYFVGRWARMFGSVMIGVPLLFQILIKAIAVAMGHDDDDEKWFTWQNEDKACWSAFDLTPLMKAMSERFPRVALWKKEHPVLGGLLPMYTGDDRANRKFGGLDPETGVANGRHYYMHFGKQGWEVTRWFTDPQGQFFSKLSMPTQRMLEGLFGRSLSWLDHELPWNDMGFAERWLNPSLDSATANMVKAFLPFTLSGVMDRGDAGLLTAFGPVQLGASGTAIQDKMVPILRDWAFNDRRGYKPVYRVGGKFHSTMTGLNSSVNHLVHEAMVNGAPASDALKIVDSALGKLTASLYGELMDALPSTPDGDFDAKRVAEIARAINRLGRKHKDLCESIDNKLKSRKTKLSPALRQKWREVIRDAFRNPYGYGV